MFPPSLRLVRAAPRYCFLNLFVAVIMEGFTRCEEIESGNSQGEAGEAGMECGLTEEEYEEFCRRWALVDPKLHKVIKKQKLYSMLAMTRKPMGLGLPYVPPLMELEASLEPMKIPVFEKLGNTHMYSFEGVVTAITKHVMRQLMGGELDEKALREAENTDRQLKHKNARRKETDKKRHRRAVKDVERESARPRKVVARTVVSTRASAREAMWRARFYEVDEDNSGELDIDELGRLMVLIGCDCTLEKLQETMDELDNDGSGTLDWDEFKQWLQTLPINDSTSMGASMQVAVQEPTSRGKVLI